MSYGDEYDEYDDVDDSEGEESVGKRMETHPTIDRELLNYGIPFDPRLWNSAMEGFYNKGVLSGALDRELRNALVVPTMPIHFYAVGNLAKEDESDLLQYHGTQSRVLYDGRALPTGKKFVMGVQTADWDQETRSVYPHVSSRDVLLERFAYSNSNLGGGTFAPNSGTMGALAPPVDPSVDSACYVWNGRNVRRVTWAISRDLKRYAYFVEFAINRVSSAGPPFSGTYYVTLNDEVDGNTGVSTGQINSGIAQAVYPLSYGYAFRIGAMKINSVTVHTLQQLSSYELVLGAY